MTYNSNSSSVAASRSAAMWSPILEAHHASEKSGELASPPPTLHVEASILFLERASPGDRFRMATPLILVLRIQARHGCARSRQTP